MAAGLLVSLSPRATQQPREGSASVDTGAPSGWTLEALSSCQKRHYQRRTCSAGPRGRAARTEPAETQEDGRFLLQ